MNGKAAFLALVMIVGFSNSAVCAENDKPADGSPKMPLLTNGDTSEPKVEDERRCRFTPSKGQSDISSSEQANTAEGEGKAKLASWDVLLKQGRDAGENDDIAYALYKLRGAWSAIPGKNYDSKPYADVKAAMIEVLKRHPRSFIQSEARRYKEQYSMEEIEASLEKRAFNCSTDEYSVEMHLDGTLALSMNRLDMPYSGESVCMTYFGRLTQEEKDKLAKDLAARRPFLEKAHKARQQELLARMPIIIKPGSAKYDELLSLCQPIKPGERKPETGFDVGPFVPFDLSQNNDLQ